MFPDDSGRILMAKRGFAAMTPARQREIASMGGKAVKRRSFSVNRELARAAGRKGGANVPAEKRTFSHNRTLAVLAGAKGGRAVVREKRSFFLNRELAKKAGALGGQKTRE